MNCCFVERNMKLSLGNNDLDLGLCGVWQESDSHVPKGAPPALQHTGDFFDDDQDVPEFVQFWERPSDQTACTEAPDGPRLPERVEQSLVATIQSANSAKTARMNPFDCITKGAGFGKAGRVHFNGNARELIGKDVVKLAEAPELPADGMCARVSDFVTSALHEEDGLGLYRDQRPTVGWCEEGATAREPHAFYDGPMAPGASELYQSVTVQCEGEGINNASLI